MGAGADGYMAYQVAPEWEPTALCWALSQWRLDSIPGGANDHGSEARTQPDVRTPNHGVEYSLTLVGHYTTIEGWTAGGVTAFKYESDRDIKRRAELLGMRTIFLDWWVKEWIRLGGDY